MKTYDYVVVRKDIADGNRQWLDTTTISGCREESKIKADTFDRRVPIMAKAHPQVGIKLACISV